MPMRIIALVVAGAATVGALVVPTAAQQKPAPAANPTDVKGIIFELANSMGMLRGLQQEDSILTLEHWANDVSRDVAQVIEDRCDIAGEPVPEHVRDFVENNVPTARQLAYRRA